MKSPVEATELVKVWELKRTKVMFAGISPDGQRIWCVDKDARHVSILEATTGKELRLLDHLTYGAFSPGSEQLFLVDKERSQFVVTDPNGNRRCPSVS